MWQLSFQEVENKSVRESISRKQASRESARKHPSTKKGLRVSLRAGCPPVYRAFTTKKNTAHVPYVHNQMNVSYRYTIIGGHRQAAQDHRNTAHVILTSHNEIYSRFRCREFSPMNFHTSCHNCLVEEVSWRNRPGLLGAFSALPIPILVIFWARKIRALTGAQNF